MPYFRIKYKKAKRTKSMVLEAENRLDAVATFRKKNLGSLLSIKQTAKPFTLFLQERLNPDPLKSNKQIALVPLIATYRQVGTMYDAGISINVILDEIVTYTEDKHLREIWRSARSSVESGLSLTESLTPYRENIGNLSLAMIRLGEETGTIGEAINKLADMLEQIDDNRRQLIRATRYPLFVIIAMMIAFVVVITMVVPQFQALFAETKMELPFPTRFLLWMEHAAVQFGPYILIGGVLLAGLFSWMYQSSDRVKLQADRMLLRVYIVGEVTRYAMLGRFVYVLATLLNAGVPVVLALETSITIVENAWIKDRLSLILQSIKSGQPLYVGFEESGLFERIVIQMLKTGEDSGSLNPMLTKINKYYADRYQHIVESIATMIEPILIAAIAGFVLVLALGIFLPLWNMVEMAS